MCGVHVRKRQRQWRIPQHPKPANVHRVCAVAYPSACSMQHAACSMQHARRSTGVDTRTNLLHGEMFQLFQGKRFGGEQPLGIAVNCILPVVQLRPQKGGVEWTLKFKFEARAIATVFATNAMSACTPTRLQVHRLRLHADICPCAVLAPQTTIARDEENGGGGSCVLSRKSSHLVHGPRLRAGPRTRPWTSNPSATGRASRTRRPECWPVAPARISIVRKNKSSKKGHGTVQLV